MNRILGSDPLVGIPGSPLISRVVLGMLLTLTVPQSSNLLKGIVVGLELRKRQLLSVGREGGTLAKKTGYPSDELVRLWVSKLSRHAEPPFSLVQNRTQNTSLTAGVPTLRDPAPAGLRWS